MSQTSNVQCVNEEKEKREVKLTAKALENKMERLQNERKTTVNKIKALIPQMKSQMKSKENVSQIPSDLEKLNALCEKANSLHNELLPLFPEDEWEKQKEWFTPLWNIQRHLLMQLKTGKRKTCILKIMQMES